MDNLIWYVSYGSNMCLERFMRYLTGEGLEEYNVKADSNRRCKDITPPCDSKEVKIPYKLYFAKMSKTWGGSVAFLDKDLPSSERSPTIGRAYLISKEQYEHVKRFEGPWYNFEIDLGELNGIPMKTFTGPLRYKEHHEVSKSYIDVIAKGIMELGYDESFAYAYVAAKKMNYVDID